MNDDEKRKYFANIGAKGGKKTSDAKTAACRNNWKKAMQAKQKKKDDGS